MHTEGQCWLSASQMRYFPAPQGGKGWEGCNQQGSPGVQETPVIQQRDNKATLGTCTLSFRGGSSPFRLPVGLGTRENTKLEMLRQTE